MFDCDQCGECCRHLTLSPLYQELDRGDGVCKFLEGNLCSIYESRPLLCRVDESFDLFFQSTMSQDEYYKQNYEACRKMKNHIF
ncbi:YkgJ family cysteine cluster protein [Flintibacter muris]|uniref:YkgJ family cysteine cluster protein n=1 Tax=Flintibacter muris TaxID=2941327 RepID=UPI00203DA202|nr:YkgJ family cysteine cluster protein [Flintibacter muris]